MTADRIPTVSVPDRMRAVRFHTLGSFSDVQSDIRLDCVPTPEPGQHELLIRVRYCGVCHTELDEIEGRTPPASLPMTPGHQVVGTVVAVGADCRADRLGESVGVAWIYSACGQCEFCRRDLENLCAEFQACGRDAHGGYAEYMIAPEAYVHALPNVLRAENTAPLLCAGAVGYRALRQTGLENGSALGMTGFGASGQLVLPMARHLFPDSPVYVFARSEQERDIARQLGAAWAGDTCQTPPRPLRAIIDTTPAWRPVLCALDVLEPGGRLVVNAIRKEAGDQDLLAELDYSRQLWLEKSLTSVANVTRADVRETLALAASISLEPSVIEYPLDQVVQALQAIRSGNIRAAGVLRVAPSE